MRLPSLLQMPIAGSRSPGYPQPLLDLATNWRFPWHSPFGFDCLLEQIIELRETLMFTSLLKNMLKQGSPTGLHSRRWGAGEWEKLRLYLQPLPIARIIAWAPPPVRSAMALDSHRSSNPTVNCTCEGSRLHAPYENLMPDDLRWSWVSDASAGEWLQIQIIISREVWLHRNHNKSIACRLISKPYQWVASENKLRAPTDSALWWVV